MKSVSCTPEVSPRIVKHHCNSERTKSEKLIDESFKKVNTVKKTPAAGIALVNYDDEPKIETTEYLKPLESKLPKIEPLIILNEIDFGLPKLQDLGIGKDTAMEFLFNRLTSSSREFWLNKDRIKLMELFPEREPWNSVLDKRNALFHQLKKTPSEFITPGQFEAPKIIEPEIRTPSPDYAETLRQLKHYEARFATLENSNKKGLPEYYGVLGVCYRLKAELSKLPEENVTPAVWDKGINIPEIRTPNPEYIIVRDKFLEAHDKFVAQTDVYKKVIERIELEIQNSPKPYDSIGPAIVSYILNTPHNKSDKITDSMYIYCVEKSPELRSKLMSLRSTPIKDYLNTEEYRKETKNNIIDHLIDLIDIGYKKSDIERELTDFINQFTDCPVEKKKLFSGYVPKIMEELKQFIPDDEPSALKTKESAVIVAKEKTLTVKSYPSHFYPEESKEDVTEIKKPSPETKKVEPVAAKYIEVKKLTGTQIVTTMSHMMRYGEVGGGSSSLWQTYKNKFTDHIYSAQIPQVIKVASMNFLDNQTCPSEKTLKQMEAFLIEELGKYTS